MIKLLEVIKRLIMKATRFILNTDYVTSQNDTEFTISVSLPSSFTCAKAEVKKFTSSKTVKSSASKDYRCYFTTTLNNYAVTGAMDISVQYGSDELNCAIQRQKDKWTLCISNPAKVEAHTYSGSSRVVTAHIMTFVDPFQL